MVNQNQLIAATTKEESHSMESTSAHTTEESHGSETGAAVLGIDPIAIALQATTFLILFLIIKKFALDKIVKNLEDRRQTIDEGLKNAEDIEIQKAELIKTNEAEMLSARKQAEDVISKSHEEAGEIIASAQTKANQQAEEIIAKAKLQAEAEANKVRNQLKAEMLTLISEATEIIIDEKVDANKDKTLIDKALNKAQVSRA